VSGRRLSTAGVKAAPVLGRSRLPPCRPSCLRCRRRSGTRQLVAGSGLDAVPATGDDIAWLMHRSGSLGLPGPGRSRFPTTASWAGRRLAAFTDGVDMFRAVPPTVRAVGRLRSSTVQRNVAV
jgi:hypothetical protein